MQKTAYLDNNVVIDLIERKYPKDDAALDTFASTRRLRWVLSPWHWVEAARSGDETQAKETANFLDSLGALWLRERIALQKREIQAYLSGRPGDIALIDPICKTVSEVASELSERKGAAVIQSSSDLVTKLLRNPSALQKLDTAYQVNEEAFAENAKNFRAGRLTRESAWKRYMCGLAKALDFSSDLARLRQAEPAAFRAISAEFEVAMEHWRRAGKDAGMRMSAHRLGDVFHIVVALPYVDYFVSQDNRLMGLLKCVGRKLPFGKAERVGSPAELLKRL